MVDRTRRWYENAGAEKPTCGINSWRKRAILSGFADNRTASGKGAQATWPLYKNFGELELRDLEDGLNWLKKQSYVNGSRIGLCGWSFGGFMTGYALTHSKSFKIGIARRSRDGLEALRHDLYGALHDQASRQPGGLQQKFSDRGCG